MYTEKEIDKLKRICDTSKAIRGFWNYNIVILEKTTFINTPILMCAGSRADSTSAGIVFLMRHWEELYRIYGNKNFTLCIGFDHNKEERYLDLEEYKTGKLEPKVLLEFVDGEWKDVERTLYQFFNTSR